MAIKISEFQLENVKRIKAVEYEPTENGLTVIGGRNNQGKTSVLDSIAWALGGDRFKPSQAQREGSVIPPYIKITLNNGMVVERKGKNSALKVIDPNGNKGGQQLLNEFIESFALNLPKFMEQTSSEKASTLLQIIGVGDKLFELERAEKETYNQRHAIGQIAEQKKKYAAEMIHYDNVPNEIISAKDLIQQQQDILLKNAENKKKKEHLSDLLERKVVLENSLKKCIEELEIAQMEAKDLEDISTKEIEENINNIDAINVKIRSNLDKEKAEDEAKHYSDQYEELSTRLEGIRQQKKSLLDNANLPLDELSVSEGEILYKGMKWDNMSGSDQLKVATAIVRKLNPECGFVLVDKLEQMDKDTMKEFAQWLENENLQVIATRVSTGDECSIIIEDGYVEGKENVNVPNAPTVKFKMGEF
uniref:AAA family ATPase n=1 Tax=Eubacterium sp. TaxID=142586 RepID=UPI00402A2E8A